MQITRRNSLASQYLNSPPEKRYSYGEPSVSTTTFLIRNISHAHHKEAIHC